MRIKLWLSISLLLLTTYLTGCGQTGDLYLPEPSSQTGTS